MAVVNLMFRVPVFVQVDLDQPGDPIVYARVMDELSGPFVKRGSYVDGGRMPNKKEFEEAVALAQESDWPAWVFG